jgi:hypothetical protein
MANKNLNEKYDIPFLSDWEDKDGNTYTALKIEHSFRRICDIPIIAYTQQVTEEQRLEMIKNQRINMFVKTVIDFKDSFNKKAIE